MSQIYKSSLSGPVPPSVATSYTTNNGTAVPLANVLLIKAKESSENNDNGIIAKGGVVGTGTSNEVDIVLTNRVTATVTTNDATPTTLLSFSLGSTPGTIIAEGDITAYNLTDLAGASYTFVGAAVTTGVVGTEIGVENKNVFEQPAMMAADFSLSVSGNNALIVVTGIAGKTIDWSCLFNFRFVG